MKGAARVDALRRRLAKLRAYSVGEYGAVLGVGAATPCVRVKLKWELVRRLFLLPLVAVAMPPKPHPAAVVCRRCGDRYCVNFEHFFWGSRRDAQRHSVILGGTVQRRIRELEELLGDE